MIAIIDYGVGNLRSVSNAFAAIGAPARVTADRDLVAAADKLVLPGVGAFGEGMAKLRQSGLDEILSERVVSGQTPILGICLGMQLMARVGYEHGEHAGLGWIPGDVRRIEPDDASLRVPHIGWNEVVAPRASALFDEPKAPGTNGRGTQPGQSATLAFYFVHSYHFVPDDRNVITGVFRYGAELVAAVQTGHIMGVQFHPEKSQRHGLGVLQKFAAFATAGC